MFLPTARPGAIVFALRRSGSLKTVVRLSFAMDDDGQVHVTTTIQGAVVPAPISLRDITARWVEQIAEQVMISVFEGKVRIL